MIFTPLDEQVNYVLTLLIYFLRIYNFLLFKNWMKHIVTQNLMRSYYTNHEQASIY
jgi:hypothetical protein